MMTNNNLKKLLLDAKRISDHQEEISTLKGENFNVFSILKMESKENETHSAFLGELLNPKGSHGFGSLFLKLFLDNLVVDNSIDISTAKLTLEKSIGLRNDVSLSGGRIDLFIEDHIGNTLCIVNKIYASDQDAQIARYCKYNRGKNKVLYLTLNGEEPSEKSCLDYQLDEDFFLISYKNDIIAWLELCQKEAIHQPILRETIYQYIILIKKLNNQLSNHQMEQEIKSLIASNYKEASFISGHLEEVELEYTEIFVAEIIRQLQEELNDDFYIERKKKLDEVWSGFWIKNRNWHRELNVSFEGDKIITWGKTKYGVHLRKEKFEREKANRAIEFLNFYDQMFSYNDQWLIWKEILDFTTVELRSRLFEKPKRLSLVNEMVEKLKDLAIRLEKPFTELSKTEVK